MNDNDTHTAEPATGASETGRPDEAIESAEQVEAEMAGEGGEERVLGLDLESPLLVTAAVGVSVLLAGLVWRRRDRSLLVVVAVFGATFAVLDVAEVAHQLDEDRTGLALLAGLIAAFHAATAVLAVHQTARTTDAARSSLTS